MHLVLEAAVNRVLRNAQWLCESELLGLAQQRISNMDATTAASNNRTKEEGLWTDAFRSGEVDFDIYEHEAKSHGETILELHRDDSRIEELANRIAVAAYRAKQLEAIVRDIKFKEIDPGLATMSVIKMANFQHEAHDDDAHEARLQRVLRYLVDRGELFTKSAASKNLEELSDFDEDPFKKISVWNTDQTAYDEDD